MMKRILLVDDEPALLDVCAEGLQQAGYEVLLAENGEDALRTLASPPSGVIDLVLSDIRMPALGGLDLLKEIKERDIDVDLLFLTGYGTVENAVECMQHGAVDYLLKPFDFSHLLAKVENAFQARLLRRYDTEVSGLMRVMSLNSELKEQTDEQSLLKKFLYYLKDCFAPDAMAFFSEQELAGAMDSRLRFGKFFRDSGKLSWCLSLVRQTMSSGRPMLIDPHVEGEPGENHCPENGVDVARTSVMISPMQGFFNRRGAVALVRINGKGAYTLSDMQLLSIFSSHAGAAAESHNFCSHIKQMNMEIVTSYVQAVEARDFYTKGHSEMVQRYSLRLGARLGLNEQDLNTLSVAALLHDIGKIGIPDGILNKPGRLTTDEQEIMQTHPGVGRDILSGIQSLNDILPIIYHHHERYDGRGYPEGLAGEDIPLLARVLQVADGFEAMTSNRAYQRARTPEQALKVLQSGAGEQWDPAIVDAWVQDVRAKGVTDTPVFESC